MRLSGGFRICVACKTAAPSEAAACRNCGYAYREAASAGTGPEAASAAPPPPFGLRRLLRPAVGGSAR